MINIKTFNDAEFIKNVKRDVQRVLTSSIDVNKAAEQWHKVWSTVEASDAYKKISALDAFNSTLHSFTPKLFDVSDANAPAIIWNAIEQLTFHPDKEIRKLVTEVTSELRSAVFDNSFSNPLISSLPNLQQKQMIDLHESINDLTKHDFMNNNEIEELIHIQTKDLFASLKEKTGHWDELEKEYTIVINQNANKHIQTFDAFIKDRIHQAVEQANYLLWLNHKKNKMTYTEDSPARTGEQIYVDSDRHIDCVAASYVYALQFNVMGNAKVCLPALEYASKNDDTALYDRYNIGRDEHTRHAVTEITLFKDLALYFDFAGKSVTDDFAFQSNLVVGWYKDLIVKGSHLNALETLSHYYAEQAGELIDTDKKRALDLCELALIINPYALDALITKKKIIVSTIDRDNFDKANELVDLLSRIFIANPYDSLNLISCLGEANRAFAQFKKDKVFVEKAIIAMTIALEYTNEKEIIHLIANMVNSSDYSNSIQDNLYNALRMISLMLVTSKIINNHKEFLEQILSLTFIYQGSTVSIGQLMSNEDVKKLRDYFNYNSQKAL